MPFFIPQTTMRLIECFSPSRNHVGYTMPYYSSQATNPKSFFYESHVVICTPLFGITKPQHLVLVTCQCHYSYIPRRNIIQWLLLLMKYVLGHVRKKISSSG